MLKSLQNRSGFSLVSTMIASSIGLIVIGGITSTMLSMQKKQVHIERKIDYRDMVDNLKVFYSNPTICEESFKGYKPPNVNKKNSDFKIGLNGRKLNGNDLSTYEVGKVKLDAISYRVLDNSNPLNPIVSVSFRPSTLTGEEIIPNIASRPVMVRFTLDPASGTIDTCDTQFDGGQGGTSSTTLDLVKGMHSSQQCSVVGGRVVKHGTNSFCKFNGASCPSGWLRYSNWTSTKPNRCQKQGARLTSISCTTKNHSWGNRSVETCWYSTSKCSATITQVGCF